MATVNALPWRFCVNHDGFGNYPTIAVVSGLSAVALSMEPPFLNRYCLRYAGSAALPSLYGGGEGVGSEMPQRFSRHPAVNFLYTYLR